MEKTFYVSSNATESMWEDAGKYHLCEHVSVEEMIEEINSSHDRVLTSAVKSKGLVGTLKKKGLKDLEVSYAKIKVKNGQTLFSIKIENVIPSNFEDAEELPASARLVVTRYNFDNKPFLN